MTAHEVPKMTPKVRLQGNLILLARYFNVSDEDNAEEAILKRQKLHI
jgi:hypothetical protein